jgi:hypothetical protein
MLIFTEHQVKNRVERGKAVRSAQFVLQIPDIFKDHDSSGTAEKAFCLICNNLPAIIAADIL